MLGVEGEQGDAYPTPVVGRGSASESCGQREDGDNDALGGLLSLLCASPLGGEAERSTHLGQSSPGFLAWPCPWLTQSWSFSDPLGLPYHLSGGIKTP